MTQLASDNFTRANENPLSQSGNWGVSNFGGDLQVVSNKCEGTSTTTDNSDIYTGVSFPNDQYVELTVPASGTNNSFVGILLRWHANTPGAQNGYFYYLSFTGASLPASLAINPSYYSSGVQAIGSSFNLTISAGDVLRLAVVGSTLYFYQNGTQVDSRVDTHFTSGSPGLYVNPRTALTDVQVPLWAAGSVIGDTVSISLAYKGS